ncbi:hypothetical protein MHLP_03795 [Candidatus Mycoplasma haematolamae str. Purdue]|uniref:Uncharacterized protein n=1 Tax=Mycoplasma haematolamae (strain Purdue) TaxID=1212765 RepID=I7CKB4_MYCHA|nr:hypothetical protein [Candidatus Mycoplasma haematolamae]AFO52339.1 hypothetical protein MHLP_03795 [Candidatus Mycoplasma haematolamae str. Purdue]
MSYASSSIRDAFNSIFSIEGAPPNSGDGSDSSITSAVTDSFGFLGEYMAKVASWTWFAYLTSINWLKDSKEHHSKYSGYLTKGCEHLQKHWKTLWGFIKNALTHLDLQKFFDLLTNSSKRNKALKWFGPEHRDTMRKMAENLQNIVKKSVELGFNGAKPFQKILKTFVEEPDEMSRIATRLVYLNMYIQSQQTGSGSRIDKLIDFFAETEQNIKGFNFST